MSEPCHHAVCLLNVLQVVNKLVTLADMSKLLGPEAFSQAPRMGLALHSLTDWGKVSLVLGPC